MPPRHEPEESDDTAATRDRRDRGEGPEEIVDEADDELEYPADETSEG